MAEGKRQYDLVINGKVDGGAEIAALADRVDELAKAGGDAAPKFAGLSAELRTLASQDTRIEILDNAITQSKAAYRELSAARDSVKSLNQALSDAKGAGATAQAIGFLEREIKKANLELTTAERAWDRQKTALDKARTSAKAAGIDTANLAKEQQRVSFEFARATGAAINAANGIDRVGNEAGDASAKLAQAGKEAAQAGAGLDKMERAASTLGPELQTMASRFAALVGANEIIGAITGFESLDRTLKALTGSEESAAQEMDYLRKVSNLMGVEVLQAGKAFVSLMASTQGTALEGEQTRRIFEAIAGSMSSLGKSGAETERALQAVSQMASKGTVSMEELRGQLGEALPGALKLAADGMGLTVEQLIEMVSQGKVLAEDLLPKLADKLREQYGAGEQAAVGLQANWARLKNAIAETADGLGDSGLTKFLSETVTIGATAIVGLAKGFDATGKAAGTLVAALASGDFDGVAEALTRIKEEGRAAIASVAKNSDALSGLIDETGKATAGAIENTTKAAAAADVAVKDAAKTTAFLSQELGKLDGKGLAEFGDKAREAFKKGQISAERLAGAVDRQVREAVKRLGVDADVAFDGLSKNFVTAADNLKIVTSSFDTLKASGRDAGAILQAAVEGAIKAAENPTELERLGQIIKDLDRDGRLAKNAAEDLLDTIRQKADEATPGINSVAEAFKAMGLASRAELQAAANQAETAFKLIKESGEATSAQLRTAFSRYAEAAIAANDGVATSALSAQAKMLGLEVTVDNAGQSIVRTMTEAKTVTEDFGTGGEHAMERIAVGASDALEQIERLGDGVARVGAGFKNAEGFASDAQGNTLSAQGNSRASVYQQLVGMGIADKAARALSARLLDEQGRYRPQPGVPGGAGLAGAIQILADRELFGTRTNTKFPPNTATRGGGSERSTPPRVYRVDVNFGGGATRSINLSSDQQAQSVLSVLQEFQKRS